MGAATFTMAFLMQKKSTSIIRVEKMDVVPRVITGIGEYSVHNQTNGIKRSTLRNYIVTQRSGVRRRSAKTQKP